MDTFLSPALFCFGFCQEKFLKSLLFVLDLISAAVCKPFAVLCLQREKRNDPLGLTAGLALTGTVSEGGHYPV